MRNDWPEPVERVASFLRAAGAEGRLEELAAETPTAEAAAEAIGCPLEQIVKSLVIVLETGAHVVVLVPGNRRVDIGKVAGIAGVSSARVASPAEVEEATGFVPGAVAPFPLTRSPLVLADRTVLSQPVVWVGAGSTRHMARFSPIELVRLSRAEAVDVASEPAYHSQSEPEKKER